MYAVIETGGKQYRVQAGDIIAIEKLEGETGTGIKFDQVLLASKVSGEGEAAQSQIWMGKPLLSGASVAAEIVGQGRGEKVMTVKMKRRKQYRRTQGHRQFLTQVLVTAVDNGAGEKSALSDADKKTKLSKFHSPLTPKGQAFTPKTLGSRKRRVAAGAPQAAAKPATKK